MSPLLAGIGGRYFEDWSESPVVAERPTDFSDGVAPYALDPRSFSSSGKREVPRLPGPMVSQVTLGSCQEAANRWLTRHSADVSATSNEGSLTRARHGAGGSPGSYTLHTSTPV